MLYSPGSQTIKLDIKNGQAYFNRAQAYLAQENYGRAIDDFNETIRLMGEIDAVIEEHGGWPIQ